MTIKLRSIRTIAPVPWSTGASTNTLNSGPKNPGTTLTYDPESRIVVADEPNRTILIPVDNVAYMLPIGPEVVETPAPAEVSPFPQAPVDDVVRFGRDAKGNVVELPRG